MITNWTTDRLSQDGKDVRVEWVFGDRFLTVFDDDCEVTTLALDDPYSITGAMLRASEWLRAAEYAISTDLIRQLDTAINRAQELAREIALDESYAHPHTDECEHPDDPS